VGDLNTDAVAACDIYTWPWPQRLRLCLVVLDSTSASAFWCRLTSLKGVGVGELKQTEK